LVDRGDDGFGYRRKPPVSEAIGTWGWARRAAVGLIVIGADGQRRYAYTISRMAKTTRCDGFGLSEIPARQSEAIRLLSNTSNISGQRGHGLIDEGPAPVHPYARGFDIVLSKHSSLPSQIGSKMPILC
jgi:hypothetical protein